jgi:hypothetical protein
VKLVWERIGQSLGYANIDECWADRANHRDEWARIIWEHNQPDGLTLYQDMIVANDILDGIRKASELRACKDAGIVHVTIWVDASKRLPPEPTSSCEIGPADCDVVVDNNTTLEDLYTNLEPLVAQLQESTHGSVN